MLEQIKAYSGYDRMGGQIKMTIHYVYRCTKCGTIKLTKAEATVHECKKETKPTKAL
jgi:rRNA maturation endonuclease Nob1